MNLCNMPLKQIQYPTYSAKHFTYTRYLRRANESDFNDDILRTSTSLELRPIHEYHPGILDVDLTAMTVEERLAFRIIVCVLCCLSLCGNISTFIVNLNRKIRPFFRACLISLALSDLLNTIFSTTIYIAQLSTEYVQIWKLGSVMCCLVQFATTTAMLASSMTLVIIALDRYFAVMKRFISKWKPGHVSGITCMLCIWTFAFAISCPVFYIYETISVYILNEINMEIDGIGYWQIERKDGNISNAIVQPKQLVSVCVSNKKDVALYYIIVFGIIFVPCIIAFVWLNATIAKEIWIRRHHHHHHHHDNHRKAASKISKATIPPADISIICESMDISKITPSNSSNSLAEANPNTRQARHLRMVIVLIVLITVFLCLRLPAWIYVLMRMYGSYSKRGDWFSYFIFGMLNLISCALNPIFYTFLHNTIQYIVWCKLRCQMRRRRFQRCIRECNFRNIFISPKDAPTQNFICCAFCGSFCGIFKSCSQADKSGQVLSHKRDDGVECYDESSNSNRYDDDNASGSAIERDDKESVDQRGLTLYSMSLMPASADRLSFEG